MGRITKACETGNIEVVKRMNPLDIDTRHFKAACANSHLKVAEWLVNNAPPNKIKVGKVLKEAYRDGWRLRPFMIVLRFSNISDLENASCQEHTSPNRHLMDALHVEIINKEPKRPIWVNGVEWNGR